MILIFSYLVDGANGLEVGDDIHDTLKFETKEQALRYLEVQGYTQRDERNYQKSHNSTLKELATLVKSNG